MFLPSLTEATGGNLPQVWAESARQDLDGRGSRFYRVLPSQVGARGWRYGWWDEAANGVQLDVDLDEIEKEKQLDFKAARDAKRKDWEDLIKRRNLPKPPTFQRNPDDNSDDDDDNDNDTNDNKVDDNNVDDNVEDREASGPSPPAESSQPEATSKEEKKRTRNSTA